jgi:hypothetical protein
MPSVPWHLVLVGALLDLTFLVLAALGVRLTWRRLFRRKAAAQRPTPAEVDLDLTCDELLESLREERCQNERRLAWLRAEDAKRQTFLGFPAV